MAEISSEVEIAWRMLSEGQRQMGTEGLAAGIPDLLRAVQGFRRAADRAAESFALDLLAGVHHELGNFEEAAAYRRAGLEAARSLNKPGTRIAKHLDGLGMALSNMGRWQEAEQVYQQALEETRKPIQDLRKLRAHILKHLADAYARYAGRFEEALRLYDEAISISRESDERYNIAASLLFKGLALDRLYRSEEAIQHYERARALVDGTRETGLLAACYAHLGGSYQNLGNLPLGRQYVERALALDRQYGNKQGIGRDLWMLGCIQDNLGDEQAAYETFEQALLIVRQIHDPQLATYILIHLAGLCDRRLQGGRAKEYLEQALEHARKLGDKQVEIEITTRLADHEGPSELFSRLEEGIAAAREQGFQGLEEELELTLARQHERYRDLLGARAHYRRAAELLEQVRVGYRTEEHLRLFSEGRADCYERLVEISLQLREEAEAFAWAERSRARVLQIMRNNRSARAAASMSEDQRRQHRHVCDRIIALDRQIQKLERDGKPVPHVLREQLQMALQSEADITVTARRSRGLPDGDMQHPEIRHEELMKCLKDLPHRTLVLSYYVGTSGVYVFCCTGQEFSVRELSSRPEEVREQVRRFRESLGVGEVDVRDDVVRDETTSRDLIPVRVSDMSRDYLIHSRNLYELLIRPIQAEIDTTDHICICPHGPLHFLPFHALHDGNQYLIERWPISYAPSATILVESLRDARRLTIRRALALGDPTSALMPLPYAREEVAQVQEILGTERCRKEVGAKASRSLVLEAGNHKGEGSHDDLWHFAMHAVFVQAAPHLSYLQLAQSESEDGRLFAHEIVALDRVAALTVMSACRTALSREARGDELNGLLFSFLAAGAQTVLATLWPVADASTMDLMMEFYKHANDSTLSLAHALRQAQIKLLGNPATSSPYHWAPVALHGAWMPVPAPAEYGLVEESELARQNDAPTLPIDVLMRQGDSLLGSAWIEQAKQSWSWLPEAERKALEEAKAVYSQILEHVPDHAVALRQRGIASYSLHDMERAESDLLRACRLDETDAVAVAVLGLIYAWDKKDSRRAAAHLERAFNLNPRLQLEDPPLRTYLLRRPLERCRAELAVAEYSRRLAEAPDDSRLYTERGHSYWLLSITGDEYEVNRGKAIQDLEHALALDPTNALALIRKTWVESPGSGPVDVYARAVEMDPGCAEAHLRFAQVLGEEQAERAIAELHAALACDPSIEHAYCLLARRYLDQGDLRRALEAFETEIERDPNCFNAHLYLTHIYAALGRREYARRSLGESVRTSHHTPYRGGPGVDLVDSIVDAIRDLARRMLATEDPDGPALSLTDIRSLFDRANTLANDGRSSEAVAVYSEILRRDPGNARAYAFRGGCYATINEADKAIADLQRATELSPNNADAWFNLALIYYNQMQFREFQAAWERAKLLDPEMVRRHEQKIQVSKPPAQQEPFDLDKALEAAFRESGIQCMHCGRRLRRRLGTQFRVRPEDMERVKEGIPYYCPLCRVNSCLRCAVQEDDSTVRCCQCGTETQPWGEAKHNSTVRSFAGLELAPSGSCVLCGQTGLLRLAQLCMRCYTASAEAVAGLNSEGKIAAQCGHCNTSVPVQLGEVFMNASGNLECKVCAAKNIAGGTPESHRARY